MNYRSITGLVGAMAVSFAGSAAAAGVAFSSAGEGATDDLSVMQGDSVVLHYDTLGADAALPPCLLTVEKSGSGVAPGLAAQIDGALSGATQALSTLTSGDFVAQLDCRQADGGFHVAWLRVASSGGPPPSPVNGACGASHGKVVPSMPQDAEACSAGEKVVHDDASESGVFEWSCEGSHGGSTDFCMAIAGTEPGAPPDENASFTGTRSGALRKSDTLQWDFPEATDCEASGNWSGPKPTTGSQSINYFWLPGSKTYGLTCSNDAGSAARSVTLP